MGPLAPIVEAPLLSPQAALVPWEAKAVLLRRVDVELLAVALVASIKLAVPAVVVLLFVGRQVQSGPCRAEIEGPKVRRPMRLPHTFVARRQLLSRPVRLFLASGLVL